MKVFWGDLIGAILETVLSIFFEDPAKRFLPDHPVLDRVLTIIVSLVLLAAVIFLGILTYHYFTHVHR